MGISWLFEELLQYSWNQFGIFYLNFLENYTKETEKIIEWKEELECGCVMVERNEMEFWLENAQVIKKITSNPTVTKNQCSKNNKKIFKKFIS